MLSLPWWPPILLLPQVRGSYSTIFCSRCPLNKWWLPPSRCLDKTLESSFFSFLLLYAQNISKVTWASFFLILVSLTYSVILISGVWYSASAFLYITQVHQVKCTLNPLHLFHPCSHHLPSSNHQFCIVKRLFCGLSFFFICSFILFLKFHIWVSPASGSGLMARSPEPVSDSVSPSLSMPLPRSCSVSLCPKNK